jgi:hypothetical protein
MMKQLLWALVASIGFTTIGSAQVNLHEPFSMLLQKYVSAAGKVDYKGLRKEKASLEAYTTALGKQVPTASTNKNASLAYWINAYNAFTLQLIVNNYPVKSITNLSGGKPWDVKFIDLGGKKYSLNQIENDIIRPQCKDARIHFALNCAAVSCPPLANTAYTEANVQALLTARTKSFLNNTSANELSASKATVSKLFDWYKADFGDVATFINQYSATKLNGNAVIAYKEYNWGLNE